MLTAYIVDTANDVVGPDGFISLREAITAANTNAPFFEATQGQAGPGDTIQFAPSLSGATILLSGAELAVSDALEIFDNNPIPVTVDGNFASRVLLIDNGAGSVTVSNISIVGGDAGDSDGGAIFIESGETLTLNSVVVADSSAKRGGGLFNNGGVLAIENGTLIDGNTASGPAADDGGGGIFNNGGALTIDGSGGLVEISNNVADGAAGSGGGIFSTDGWVTINQATIRFNEAVRAGGGIEVVSGMVDLINSNLINNDALGGAAPGNGGGLHATADADIHVAGGSVFGNFAAREGGGLWNASGTLTLSDGALVQANEAAGPAADDGGGGIFNNGGEVVIDGSTERVRIVGNFATGTLGSGGGIFNATGGTIDVTAADVEENEAERAGGGIEDAANVAGVIGIRLEDVALNGNLALGTDATAAGNGGGLHVSGVGHVLIDGGAVNDNFAAREGGGLWNGGGTMTVQNGTLIDGNTASGPAADDGGGGIFNNGGALTIDGSGGLVEISNNVADGAAGSGGGIFSTDGWVTINQATIRFNEAVRAGGGIEVVSGMVDLIDSNLINNDALGGAAPGNGGGLHATADADIHVAGGSVFGNFAAREGGGLWNASGTLTLSDGALVQANEAAGPAADDGGGGIFNNGGEVVIDGSTERVRIVGNFATGTLGSGGGIFNATGGTIDVTAADVEENEAERAGGGIEDAANVAGAIGIRLEDVALNGNLALGTDATAAGNGGGLHVSGVGHVLIDGGAVNDNFAAREGGGLWNGGGTMTVTGGVFVQANEAAGDAADDGGGGIFNNGGELVIDGSAGRVRIIGNLATGTLGGGGGIFNAAGGSVDIVWAKIADNIAYDGGGLFNTGLGASVSLRRVAVEGNTAINHGGGIASVDAGDVSLQLGAVSENTAGMHGGGIYLASNGSFVAVTSTVTHNRAGRDASGAVVDLDGAGGGIWVGPSATADLSFVTVVCNDATGMGGGIRNSGGGVAIRNSIVTGNISQSDTSPTDEDVSGMIDGAGVNLVASGTVTGGLQLTFVGALNGLFCNDHGLLDFAASALNQVWSLFSRFQLNVSPINHLLNTLEDTLNAHALNVSIHVAEALSWHNAALPLDVNGDNSVAVADVRLVFTHLVDIGAGKLSPNGPTGGGYMIDADNDGAVGLSDLRLVLSGLLNLPSVFVQAESEPDESHFPRYAPLEPTQILSRAINKLWGVADDWWRGSF